MLKPVEKPIKFIKNISTKGKSFPITHVNAVIDDNGESIKSTIDSLKNKGSLTKVTWLELKDKRDTGKLTPGALYRITDYQCTTTQENTQSAGHQFDIVLLALSENKLAEEGWAMEHPTDVYDVTFGDGVTKKCYLYFESNVVINLVEIETLVGSAVAIDDFENIDKTNKTAIVLVPTDILTEENLPYNYFQNSNLSAWKVWYCLDNDKSRFAWADDSVDEDSPAKIIADNGYGEFELFRNSSFDRPNNIYGWAPIPYSEDSECFTTSETPSIGDHTVDIEGNEMSDDTITSYTPAHEGTGLPNGRGVIYRLIDEWNIDYPCDFKNMQMLIPMDGDDNIDMKNPVTSKYCYAFTDNTSGEPEDLSIKGHAINIKVKPRLIEEINSVMYSRPGTLFYTNHNEEQNCKFSSVTVGTANTIMFINRGHNINILDGSSNVILKDCRTVCIGYGSTNIMLNAVSNSTFGSNCKNIQLANVGGLNYGNNGVELATKS